MTNNLKAKAKHASYWKAKAKNAYKMYKKGLERKKVYAVVEKDGLYAVIRIFNGKHKYMLAGGSVEKRESNEKAIIREINEELNMHAEIIRSLGVIHYKVPFEYKNKKFEVGNIAEIFLAKYVSDANNKTHGVKGEFEERNTIELVTREEMLKEVEEFCVLGVKL